MSRVPSDRRAFGKLIKKRLIDLDLTQVDLAMRLDMNPVYLGLIIQGRKSPGKYEAAILAEVGLSQEWSHGTN